MAKLTQEKLDEFRQTVEDLGSALEKRKDEAYALYESIEAAMDDLSDFSRELDYIEVPQELEEEEEEDALAKEAQELADKVAPEKKE